MPKNTRGGTVLFRHADTDEDICTAFLEFVPAKDWIIELGPVDGVMTIFDVKRIKLELSYPKAELGLPHCQHSPIVYIKEPLT